MPSNDAIEGPLNDAGTSSLSSISRDEVEDAEGFSLNTFLSACDVSSSTCISVCHRSCCIDLGLTNMKSYFFYINENEIF
jgi:hypothetical protein